MCGIQRSSALHRIIASLHSDRIDLIFKLSSRLPLADVFFFAFLSFVMVSSIASTTGCRETLPLFFFFFFLAMTSSPSKGAHELRPSRTARRSMFHGSAAECNQRLCARQELQIDPSWLTIRELYWPSISITERGCFAPKRSGPYGATNHGSPFPGARTQILGEQRYWPSGRCVP